MTYLKSIWQTIQSNWELKLSILFTLTLSIYEIFIFRTDYSPYIEKFFTPGTAIVVNLVLLLTVLIAQGLMIAYFYFSFQSKIRWRAIYFFLFMLGEFIEYGSLAAFGRFITHYEVSLGVSATSSNWISSIATYFSPWVFLPLISYAALLFTQTKTKKRGGKDLAYYFFIFLCFVIILHPSYRLYEQIGKIIVILISFAIFYVKAKKYGVTDLRYLGLTAVFFFAAAASIAMPAVLMVRQHMKPSPIAFFDLTLSTPIRAPYLIEWPWLFYYKQPRDQVPLITNETPTNNIVIILEESYRADHLSVNGYERETTPYLDQLQDAGWVYNWGTISSAATHSYASDAVMGMGIDVLPDVTYQTRLRPTIFQYAKAMGYETHYLSGQISHYPEEMYAEDMQYIDNWTKVNQLKEDTTADFQIAEIVYNALHNKTGQFVFIQKKGTHWPYNSNYPDESIVWKADNYNLETDPRGLSKMLIDMYDNSILYNSENFFHSLIQTTDLLDNTIIVYTSDHGQTLSENGEAFTHSGPTRNEAAVPLLVITKLDYPFTTDYPASHANIFPTVLDLMGYPQEAHFYDYAASLLNADPSTAPPRFYLFGALHGQGFNQESEVPRENGMMLPFDEE